MTDLKFNTYTWQTSAKEVLATVESVARSKSPHVEFGLDGNAAAAREASEFGWLEFVANGVVQLTEDGRHLTMEKDPLGMVMNIAATRELMNSGYVRREDETFAMFCVEN